MRHLERELADLEHRTNLLDRMSERFDEWEACLSWAPVTEYGDPDGRYGFMYDGSETPSGYLPAISIDYSEWDDPGYEFLVFSGRDRPFVHRECGNKPGEEIDRRPPARSGHGPMREGLPGRRRVRRLRQCAYLLGLTEHVGRTRESVSRSRRSRAAQRLALAMTCGASTCPSTRSWQTRARNRPASSATRPRAAVPTTRSRTRIV